MLQLSPLRRRRRRRTASCALFITSDAGISEMEMCNEVGRKSRSVV